MPSRERGRAVGSSAGTEGPVPLAEEVAGAHLLGPGWQSTPCPAGPGLGDAEVQRRLGP